MKEIFRDYLFTKHILVSPGITHDMTPDTTNVGFHVLTALAHKFGIRVTEGAGRAISMDLINDAARNLGEYVPEPFYRGFPQTVREMTADQLLFDQLLHYTYTYGLGWFDRPGHSVAEEEKDDAEILEDYNARIQQDKFWKMAFDGTQWSVDHPGEGAEVKEFRILTEPAARTELWQIIRDLMGGNRPLNKKQKEVIYEAWITYGTVFTMPEKMPCKQTAVYMLRKTRDLRFCRYLKLSDVIKLVEEIQYQDYHSENIHKLNLRNQDRKLITQVIHELWTSVSRSDIPDCFAKRKAWKGLLHHIHFKPIGNEKGFVEAIMLGKENFSNEAIFENYMRADNPVQAARFLNDVKGSGALLRNLNYILSRCDSDHEIEEVLSCLE